MLGNDRPVNARPILVKGKEKVPENGHSDRRFRLEKVFFQDINAPGELPENAVWRAQSAEGRMYTRTKKDILPGFDRIQAGDGNR